MIFEIIEKNLTHTKYSIVWIVFVEKFIRSFVYICEKINLFFIKIMIQFSFVFCEQKTVPNRSSLWSFEKKKQHQK